MFHNHCRASNGTGHARKVGRIIVMSIFGVIFAALFALLFGWVVMLLWNWLMPGIFGIKALSYWQAFGVTVLAKVLFGCSFHGGHRGHPRFRRLGAFHDKGCRAEADVSWGHDFGGFTDDEMKHYREFWKECGAGAFRQYLQDAKEKNGTAS